MVTKQDILNYVMESPYNTNPNVLNPMLEEYGGITPSGSINITSNGEYNVTDYASANVSVSSQSPVKTKTSIRAVGNSISSEDTISFMLPNQMPASVLGVSGKVLNVNKYTLDIQHSSKTMYIDGYTNTNLAYDPEYVAIAIIPSLDNFAITLSGNGVEDDVITSDYIYIKLNGKNHVINVTFTK